MKFVIIKSAYGSPDGNWFPWLSKKLIELGHVVVCPRFPTPEEQNLENWLATFDSEFGLQALDSGTVFIGHSIGVAFTLRLLQYAKVPVVASFLVAGFARTLALPQFDHVNSTF